MTKTTANHSKTSIIRCNAIAVPSTNKEICLSSTKKYVRNFFSAKRNTLKITYMQINGKKIGVSVEEKGHSGNNLDLLCI